jgi:rhodanese-related sulfurtransferase/predicted transcriptional regulator
MRKREQLSTVNVKHEIYTGLARVAAALSSATRLELLELLAQRERPVEELAALSGASVANVSQHLQKLRQAGLVVARKSGQYVRYRLVGDEVVRMLSILTVIGQAHAAELAKLVETYFASRDTLEPVEAGELLRRAKKGLVTVLDVRPPDEYAAGHLPRAINIPIAELKKRIAELPRSQEVVAYCRGPYCLMSYDAVELLRRKGVRARRLRDGFPEWRAAGFPVEGD